MKICGATLMRDGEKCCGGGMQGKGKLREEAKELGKKEDKKEKNRFWKAISLEANRQELSEHF
jgi:hypothetical protein